MGLLDSFTQGISDTNPTLGRAVQAVGSGDLGTALKGVANFAKDTVTDFPKQVVQFSPAGQVASAANSLGGFKTSPAEVALGLGLAGLGVAGGAAGFHQWRETTAAGLGEAGSAQLFGGLGGGKPPLNTEADLPANLRNTFRVSQFIRPETHSDPEAIARVMGRGQAGDYGDRFMQHYGFVNGLTQRIPNEVDVHAQALQQTADPAAARSASVAFELAKFDQAVSQGLIKDKPIRDLWTKYTTDPSSVPPEKAAQLQDYIVNLAKETQWVDHPMWAVHPMLKIDGIQQSDSTGKFDFKWKQAPAYGIEGLQDDANRTRAFAALDHRALLPQMVENIKRVANLADPDTWGGNSPPNNGILFYPKGRLDIASTAKDLPTPHPDVRFSDLHPETGPAITSLLSAAQSWKDNVDKFASITAGPREGETPDDHLARLQKEGWMIDKTSYGKVMSLLPTADNPTPEARIPDVMVNNKSAETAMRAQKQVNFWINLAHPELWQPATIDRHAYDIAMGMDTGLSKRPLDRLRLAGGEPYDDVYGTVSSAYHQVAMEMGITPSELQALTWDAWKKMKTSWDEDRNGRLASSGKRKGQVVVGQGGWSGANGPLVIDDTILRQMQDGFTPEMARQVDGVPKSLLGMLGEPGVEPAFVAGSDGVGVAASPDDGTRAEWRVLYPGSDPNDSGGSRVPLVGVRHRPLFDGPGEEAKLHAASLPGDSGARPALAFDHWVDPSLPAHPGLAQGSNLLVSSPDPHALGALGAHVRHYVVGNDVTDTLNGPGRTTYDVRGEPLGRPDFSGMTAEEMARYFAAERWATISAQTSAGAGDHQGLGRRLTEMGYKPIDQIGHYGGSEEKSWLVPGMPPSEAMKLGREYGQESVGSPHGILWSDGSQMVRPTGDFHVWDADGPAPAGADPDNYSEFRAGKSTYRFSMATNDGDWEAGPPVPDDLDMQKVRQINEPRKSLLIRLGDHPTPQQVQAVVNAVAQVSAETGVDFSPRLYLQGTAAAPNGYMPVAEHLHKAGPVIMSHLSRDLDNESSHSVPVWVPGDSNVTANPATAARTPAFYAHDNVPADALINGHTRLYYRHLLARPDARADLRPNVLDSRFPEPARFVAINIPADDSVMPAVGLGVDAAQQAAKGLEPASPDPSRTVMGHKEGRTWYLDAPDENLRQQAISLLRTLGHDGAIKMKKAASA